MRGAVSCPALASRGARTRLIACAACMAVLVAGCGSRTPTTRPVSIPSQASLRAAWAAGTQQLCRQKRAAIAALGNVHITYGGIARVGLPAVKRSLDRYLARLLAVLRGFSQRQRQLATPPSLVSTMSVAAHLDKQSQGATSRLRHALTNAKDASELSAAFRVWLVTLRGLAVRGDAVARRLDLPACGSGSAGSSS